eukprot:9501351-Pyramimonas_sp.AAC.1
MSEANQSKRTSPPERSPPLAEKPLATTAPPPSRTWRCLFRLQLGLSWIRFSLTDPGPRGLGGELDGHGSSLDAP